MRSAKKNIFIILMGFIGLGSNFVCALTQKPMRILKINYL